MDEAADSLLDFDAVSVSDDDDDDDGDDSPEGEDGDDEEEEVEEYIEELQDISVHGVPIDGIGYSALNPQMIVAQKKSWFSYVRTTCGSIWEPLHSFRINILDMQFNLKSREHSAETAAGNPKPGKPENGNLILAH